MLANQILAEFGNRSLNHDGTAIHDVKSVTDFEAKVEILFHKQNADLSLLFDL